MPKQKSTKETPWVAGIDEAGRGPLAGPVSVGVVLMKRGDLRLLKAFPLVLDSKKLSPKMREEFFVKVKKEYQGRILFSTSLVSAQVIDTKGIVYAIHKAMRNCLMKLQVDPLQTEILLDGSLYAPNECIHQKTIIKGDACEQIIGLASICAKVTRDIHMVRLSKKYSQYGFEIHKGYGTKSHRNAIKKYGVSEVHRKSFLKDILHK